MVTPAWFLRMCLDSGVGGGLERAASGTDKRLSKGGWRRCVQSVPSAPRLELCCLETFGENANEGRQTEGPHLRMKTSTNTAAAAQIGAVKGMITTTDDSVAAKK